MPTLKKQVEPPRAEPERRRSFWGWIRLTSRGFARACIGVVNLLLAFSALLLSLILGLSYFGKELPIPAAIIQQAADSLEEQGIHPEWDALSIDLTGRVHLRGLKLLDARSRDALLTAGAALVHVDPILLCFGRLDVIEIQVEGAALHAPAIISDSGNSIKLLNDVTASIHLGGITPEVRHLQGMFNTVHFVAGGVIPLLPKTPPEEISLANAVRRAAGLLIQGRQYLDYTHSPILFADLQRMELRLLADQARWGNWSIDEPLIHVRLGPELTPRSAQASAASIIGPSAAAARWHASARWQAPVSPLSDGREWNLLPSIVHAHTTGLMAAGQTLDGLVLAANDPKAWTLNARFAGEPVEASIHAEGDHFAILAEGSVLLTPVLEAAGLPVEQILSRFRVHSPIRFSAGAVVGRDAMLESAHYKVELRDIDARGTLMDYISASGRVFPGEIFVDTALAQMGNQQAEGSFHQDLETMDWRLLLRGRAYPEGLGPMLGSWWDSIWPGFEFPGPPLRADLDLRGNWNDTTYADVRGHMEGSNIIYNGVALADGSLDLWGGKTFVLLHNMDIRQEDGQMDGHILLRYPVNPAAARSVGFDIRSSAPLAIVNQAFQANLDDLVNQFTLAEAPRLHMYGNVVQTSNGWLPLLEVDAEAGQGSWRSITFDELRLHATHNARSTRIQNLEAQLMGGRGTGEILFTNRGRDTEVDFSMQLNLTQLHSTVTALQTLADDQPEPVYPDSRKGWLDLSLAGRSLLNDFAGNLRASGRGEVSQADLGTIRLFGELSEAFTGLGLGFTRFAFERGVGDFEIRSGQMIFRDVAIFGQNANIEANGRLDLSNSSMDFDVRVFLLRGDTPSLLDLVGVLLSPLGYALELQLSGTLDAPNWRLKIDPRNLFTGGATSKDRSRELIQPPSPAGPGTVKNPTEAPAQ